MVAPEWVVQRPQSASEWGATNRAHGIFKGRHFEAMLILQAVSWYLRYPLSYRDIEELFRERGLAVNHATLNRRVLAYAPLIERWLRSFRKPHCGSLRIDESRTISTFGILLQIRLDIQSNLKRSCSCCLSSDTIIFPN